MKVFLLFCGFLVSSVFAESAALPDLTRLEKERLKCRLCADFEVVPYGIAETEHAKVLLHPNQYYLGRIVVIAKLDKKDLGMVHYPSMEWIFKNRPEIYKELMTVVYATHEARRRWVAGYKLPEPMPFNDLVASNLAYGKDKLPGQPADPHAHIHSWMRYAEPIRINYSRDFAEIKLASGLTTKAPDGRESAIFTDTEYGSFIFFEAVPGEAEEKLPQEKRKWLSKTNSRQKNLPEPLMRWITESIRKELKPLMK